MDAVSNILVIKQLTDEMKARIAANRELARKKYLSERRRVLAERELATAAATAAERKRDLLTSRETLEQLTRQPYYSRENLNEVTKVERQVIERYGTSASWILRRQRDAGFPRHVPLGGRLRFWRLADLEQWEKRREGQQ